VNTPVSRHALRLRGATLVAVVLSSLAAADTPRAASAAHAPASLAASTTPAATAARSNMPRSVQLTPEAANILMALAHRTADASQAGALFAPKSWYTPPPPPPPAAPAAAAAPTAPPLPFEFLGSFTDANNVTVYFVTRDDRVYDVKPGDVIDPIYSIEAAENGQLVFLYKPLNTRQPLAIGETP